jgi:hypothetical protein
LLAIGLAAAADLAGEPIGLLDAGCSAGLNLLIDRYRFEYGACGSPRAEEDRTVETAETTVCRRFSSHVFVVFLGDEALRRLPEMRCGYHQLGS